MGATGPRIAPLPEGEWDAEARELIERSVGEAWRKPPKLFTTLVRHPKLLKRWLVFGAHILRKSSLPARERELVILRTGWLCRAEYEWGHHVVIGKEAGITDDEVVRITQGAAAPGWSALDAALLRATDELCADKRIADDTWATLAKLLDTRQLMDLTFTVGEYVMVSMVLRTLGVEHDEGYPRFPT